MADRVSVFIDYQNCYKRARDAFFGGWSPSHLDGQVYPRLLALALKNGAAGERELEGVYIYRGMPSQKEDQKGYSAAYRQVSMWDQQKLVHPYTRQLNYFDPANPKEKGIDVKLAIDMVMAIERGTCEKVILMSEDTDLLPALEAICEKTGSASAVEVACWVPSDNRSAHPLRSSGNGWLIHRLREDTYRRVHDNTDYTLKRRRR
jgi:uncharacterized LabA/DUF88 family protein